MAIADRYILRQVAKPILAAIAIGMMVLLAERMVRLLDVTLGKRNSFAVVFELLAYLAPHYLGLAVPLALFLGLLLGFNKISKDSELDAFLAAGIGLHRLARPVMILAAVLSAASVIVFGWMQPHTRYAYRAVMFTVANVEVFYLAEEGVFMQSGTRTFILDKLQRGEGAFEHIFIFDYKGAGGAETTTAARGRLIEAPGQTRPVLRLENGQRLKIEKWPHADAELLPLPQAGSFTTADTPLGTVGNQIFRPRGNDERELTLTELYTRVMDPPANSKPRTLWENRSELHKRAVMILTTLVLPFLALPFAITRRRSQRAYRIGLALIILIAYHEVVERGAVLVRVQQASPYLTVWLPFAALAAFAFWRFWIACFRLPSDKLDQAITHALKPFGTLRRSLAAKLGRNPA
ncbi:MAG: LptF/LptG family permease [Aestuariivirgaceae bacterium]|nr:LptF/LptG family permease [Aestuariivirgaceae bacterium]